MSEGRLTQSTDREPQHVGAVWLALAATNGLDSLPSEAQDHLLGPACASCAQRLASIWSERAPSDDIRVESHAWPAKSTLALAFATFSSFAGDSGQAELPPAPSELATSLRLSDATVEVDPFRAFASDALSDHAALCARYLALAELRREAQPGGPWTVDSALQAINVAEAVGAHSTSTDAVAAFASWRAREAVECLLGIPEQALARGGRDLRDMLDAELFPLVRWLETTSAGEKLHRWLAGWPVGVPAGEAEGSPVGAEAFMHSEAKMRLRVDPQAVVAGLVDAWALATLERGVDGDVWEASLPLSATLAAMYLRAQRAAPHGSSPGGDAVALANAKRDRILLRSLVVAPGLNSSATESVLLPTLAVRQFDPETGELLSLTSLSLDSTGTLRGLVPHIDGTVIRVDFASSEPLTARAVAAQALVVPYDYWVTAAEEAASLADQISDEPTTQALLSTAWVLAASEVDSAVGLAAELRASIQRARMTTPERLDLWTVGCELQSAILRERSSAGDAIWHGLGPSFESLDGDTKMARVQKYAEVLEQLDALDSFLSIPSPLRRPEDAA